MEELDSSSKSRRTMIPSILLLLYVVRLDANVLCNSIVAVVLVISLLLISRRVACVNLCHNLLITQKL